jgi:TolB protein
VTRRLVLPLLLLAGAATAAQAQTDTIRLGVHGASVSQPGLVVLAGADLDSVRAIVQRDLENSDRFTVAHLSDSAGTLHGPFDPKLLQATGGGLTWAVELEPAIGGVDIKLYDVATGIVRQEATRAADVGGVGDSRVTVHRVSDLIVSWTGGIGIAATRIAFKLRDGKDDAIWRIDNDGANLVRISSTGHYTMTPAWSPDGSSIAYSEYRDGRWVLNVKRLASGSAAQVPTSGGGDAYGPAFSPDGKTLVFVHGMEKGADLEAIDLSKMCCVRRITHDAPLADNLSPAYSPDGQRIAFVSNRTGTPEVYAVDEDGTSRSLLVESRFDPNGKALPTYSPAWSPDATRVAFARETDSGGRQLYTSSVGSGQIVQLTATGRNEDPSWAPDSRHIVFKSTRSGREQLWVWDIVSGASRQLATPGGAQYPAWSHTIGSGTSTNP